MAFIYTIIIVFVLAVVVILNNMAEHLADIYQVMSAHFGRLLEQDRKEQEKIKEFDRKYKGG